MVAQQYYDQDAQNSPASADFLPRAFSLVRLLCAVYFRVHLPKIGNRWSFAMAFQPPLDVELRTKTLRARGQVREGPIPVNKLLEISLSSHEPYAINI